LEIFFSKNRFCISNVKIGNTPFSVIKKLLVKKIYKKKIFVMCLKLKVIFFILLKCVLLQKFILSNGTGYKNIYLSDEYTISENVYGGVASFAPYYYFPGEDICSSKFKIFFLPQSFICFSKIFRRIELVI
jgi:hypothetical protein